MYYKANNPSISSFGDCANVDQVNRNEYFPMTASQAMTELGYLNSNHWIG